ncbi:hypothetical protein QC762_120130 [Podospora pseudocomata]|uniref:Nitrogen regulatory protein areA GATA-like domain-containing protein n=1 Tax=Podospora pseudocomata TaxID=2093779 RepID=A0ABR0GY76_9PEZI|nr:hypothetical protein QC762_120130 [Podospora pseudocomata]
MEAMAMAMLLPKGLVENTREIYKEVASYPIVPPEKLWQYWNVYTTTSRKLVDPTAYRLEHFWWHVWGSDRRYLSGPTLAKLFEEVSHGPTFVPLRSVRNRYEGPSGHSDARNHGRGDAKAASRQGQPNQNSDQQRSAPVGGMKLPTPSSSRPPPAHPILKKKNRGPSGSKPRPTARFVDPSAFQELIITPLTEPVAPQQLPSSPPGEPVAKKNRAAAVVDEAQTPTAVDMPPPPKPSPRVTEMPPPPKPSPKRKNVPSAVTVAGGTDVRPPPISPAKPERAAPPTGRRIVASTAASKRRPVMSRRQSSQSSGGTGTRVVSPATAALVKQVVAQKSKGQEGVGHQDSAIISSSTESQGVVPPISAKSAGKRPAEAPIDQPVTTAQNVHPPPNQADGRHNRPLLATESRPLLTAELKPPTYMAAPFQRRSTWDLDAQFRVPRPQPRIPGGLVQDRAQRPSFGLQRSGPMMAGFVTSTTTSPIRESSSTATAPKIVRSRSSNTDNRLSLMALPTGITSVVATTTPAIATARFDSEPVAFAPREPEARDIPDSVMDFSRRFTTNPVLQPCFTPTPPNPAPPIPYGRSKSQLHLLLEKEKEKLKRGNI